MPDYAGVVQRGAKFAFYVRIGDKKIWRSGFTSAKQARDARSRFIRERDAGQINTLISKSQSLENFLDEWLEGLAIEGLDATTVDWYRFNVAHYVSPKLGSIKVNNLTRGALQALYGELRASGGKNGQGLGRTVKAVHVTLHKALEAAVAGNLIARNPAHGIKVDSGTKSKSIKFWTPEQSMTFLEHELGQRWRTLWALMLATGLRRGEALGLPRKALAGEYLQVSQELRQRQDGSVEIAPPKTKASNRRVKVDAQTLDLLQSWLDLTALEATDRGQAPSALMFVEADGRSPKPKQLTRLFDRHSVAAGLPKIGLKGLRHSHATALLLAGVNPKVVSERLGHSNIKVTLDIYSHVTSPLESEAADIIGRALYS